jgi:hypothetical protein
MLSGPTETKAKAKAPAPAEPAPVPGLLIWTGGSLTLEAKHKTILFKTAGGDETKHPVILPDAKDVGPICFDVIAPRESVGAQFVLRKGNTIQGQRWTVYPIYPGQSFRLQSDGVNGWWALFRSSLV